MVFIQVILILVNFTKSKGAPQNASLEITACYDNSSTFADMIKNKPRVVDVLPGSIVHLWCHFCEGNGDYFPKLWFYKPRGNKFPKEIFKGIDINDSIPKLYMTPLHILTLNNFNVSDSGIYVCARPEKRNQNTTLPFIYILEGVINSYVKLRTGTLNQWLDYKRIYIDPINKRFKLSEEAPLKFLRHNFNLTFKLITIWENWGECTEIDHQNGIRRKLGRCRLRASIMNKTRKIMNKHSIAVRNALSYLTDGFDIPCRSYRLNKTVPRISKLVKDIPDYQAEETCYVLKKTAKHKTNKDKYKLKSMKQVAENSHVTLSCTEVIPNSDLKWFKEEKLLNSIIFRKNTCKNEEEPHISVDTNNSLHILHISKKEEGNYSCLLNGKTVQEFEVKVLTKAKLLNQEFIRYSIYLGFVLSLTMTCYCAGVCVAWHRKSSFADPLNLHKKENYGHNSSHSEREKLLG